MRSIRAIKCHADLDDSPALNEARANAAEGDESWQQWVDEYDHGRALILRLEVTIAFDDGDGIDETHTVNQGIWIEVSPHPPAVAGQLEEIVSKDFNVLGARLRDEGIDVSPSELADMHVEVDMSMDVLRALEESPVGGRGLQPEIGSGS